MKAGRHRLRGAIAQDLAAGGTQVSEDSYNLLKFHGTYEQYDRDTATDLKQHGQEKDYSFMVRVRMPAGRLTADQYLALDALADRYGNATLRVTTRQAIQFHGIVKGDLKAAIAGINETLLTTQAACGDVVRNVTTSPAPIRDVVHARLESDARALSSALLPASRAYHQIFLDEADSGSSGEEAEPLYGATYLPRKFKIGVAVATDNTVDILTNDLGLIAVFEGDTLRGYNVAVGGGLGMTHNRADTYPRLATIVGSVGPDEMIAVTRAVIELQRDNGDRSDRKRARLKYVIDDMGVDWVRATIGTYFGRPLMPPLPMPDFAIPDLLGWHEQGDGKWWLGVPVPSGRIGGKLRTALREIVSQFGVDPVYDAATGRAADQYCADRSRQDRRATPRGGRDPGGRSRARACRMGARLPGASHMRAGADRGGASPRADRRKSIEAVLREHGLADARISLRITGCPNGCARPYAGDIGLVGRVPGAFAIYLGGDFEGTRLSFQFRDRVPQDEMHPSSGLSSRPMRAMPRLARVSVTSATELAAMRCSACKLRAIAGNRTHSIPCDHDNRSSQ